MMRQAAQRYLQLRRSLGYELQEPGRLLLDFAGHLDALGVTRLTIDAVAAWATAPQDATAYWHWLRLSAVRGFAIHLHTLDPGHQVPPADLLPRQYTRPAPYLFSEDEVAALMRAAGRMRHGPAALTYQTLIGLLAVTGIFSRGEDRCKSGVLADRAGSGVVIHPPSPREVVVHVAGPRWPGF